jgi:hypothetical protein
MTPKGQESFNFEEDSFPPEPIQNNESGNVLEMPKREDLHDLAERENECQYCGHPYDSADSCKYCKGDKTKLAYLSQQKEKLSPNELVSDKNEPVSRGALILAEMERLRKVRLDIAGNENALRAIAEINVSATIDPSKFKSPEDPNFH